MSGERLTRTELSWLLTQEAKSAAQKLRKGVGLGSASTPAPPPVTVLIPAAPESGQAEEAGVETMLNRLDETMSMLASLHGHHARGRRGKIDLAALLWEIAPEARVQIEMGKGLVTFGDESDLRRMLHVLMALGGDPIAKGEVAVSMRRDGDEIRVAVELGPDTSQGLETEVQWLSRMAIRLGGHLALEGNTQTLVLPATDELRELEALKRELAAAQAQGEAYARELAAVMARSEPAPSSPTGGVGTQLSSLVGTARALVTDVRGILAAIGRDMAPLRERGRWGEHDAEIGEIASSVNRHVAAASEIVSDLARLAGCPLGELPSACQVTSIVRDVVKAESARASRHEVEIALELPESCADDVLPAQTVGVLLQDLLDAAISTSPPRSTVRVSLVDSPTGVVVCFDDAGEALSPKAKAGALARDFDALVQERSASLPLIAAFAIALQLRATLTLEDAPGGGTRARVALPRPQA